MLNIQRLIDLRELYGFSRKELSKRLSISEQAVCQYENGQIEPSFVILQKLTDIFHVKSDYFFQNDIVPHVANSNRLIYRTKFNKNIKDRKFEIQYINHLHEYIQYFKSFVQLNHGSLKPIQQSILNLYYSSMLFENRIKNFDEIASKVRMMLDIQNNKDLMYILEKFGVYIIEKPLSNDQDAYSIWIEDTPYIILNKNCGSEARRTFSLAHELGHLLLHKNIDFKFLSTEEYKNIEQEANIFASCFLLPKDDIERDFKCLSRPSNPNSYIILKEKYHISISAIEYRCYQLNLLTQQQHRYFYKMLNQYGYRYVEPFDKEWSITIPGQIYFMIKYIFDNHLLSIEKILDDYNVTPFFLNHIFNFRKNIFDVSLNYHKNQKKMITYQSTINRAFF